MRLWLSALVVCGLLLGRTSSAQVEISISIDDVSGLEGDTSAESVVLAFPLTVTGGTPTKDVTVHFSTASGTAAADVDYVHVSDGLVTIPAGSTTGFATVNVIEDLNVEPDETLTVTINQPTNTVIGGGVATGTIINDDEAQIPTLGLTGLLLLGAALLAIGRCGSRTART